MVYGINFGIIILFLLMMEIEYGIFIKVLCIVLMEINIFLSNLEKKVLLWINLLVDHYVMEKDVYIYLIMIIINI